METEKIDKHEPVPHHDDLTSELHWKRFRVPLFLIILAAIPLTIFISSQSQDIRQRAAGPGGSHQAPTGSQQRPNVTPRPTITAPLSCSNDKTDVMLVFDHSTSMHKTTSTTDKTTRMEYAKKAGSTLVNIMATNSANIVGIASFARRGGIDVNYTTVDKSVLSTISGLSPDKQTGTCLNCAMIQVNDAIQKRIAAGIKTDKVVIILSDGNINRYLKNGGKLSDGPDLKKGRQVAYDEIMKGHNRDHTVFYTIGLGGTANNDGNKYLQKVAHDTGGKYYFAATAANLQSIYKEIGVRLSQGTVSGIVFEDTNGNGKFDKGTEHTLPGWTVQLRTSALTTNTSSTSANTNNKPFKSTVTDKVGFFQFKGLCNGKYVLVEVVKTGYKQTVPAKPAYYPISVTDDNKLFPNKNFGNQKAKVTPPPAKGPVSFTFRLALHGIGIAGDSVVPRPDPCQKTGFSATDCHSNQSPLHRTRDFSVELLDSTGKTVATSKSPLTYNSSLGVFTTTAKVTTLAKAGIYTFRFTTPMFLKAKAVYPKQVVPGGKYVVPMTDMIASDVDNDNKLTILDYNLIIRCYTNPNEPQPTCDQTDTNKVDTDDNGKDEEFDFNLFVREISQQYTN